ncbi:hypothetical protein IE53DRAFT_220748 [Violaceomyces palustris]|uniref:Uncharacterized protein n=1 Tax=Violaceomyces palustris TaxID=1673888 RepID=A0ACD0NQ84_9BASI|nr:hypothetical protein IE53DRAFT_220748 [Violaceomyces palustris]
MIKWKSTSPNSRRSLSPRLESSSSSCSHQGTKVPEDPNLTEGSKRGASRGSKLYLTLTILIMITFLVRGSNSIPIPSPEPFLTDFVLRKQTNSQGISGKTSADLERRQPRQKAVGLDGVRLSERGDPKGDPLRAGGLDIRDMKKHDPEEGGEGGSDPTHHSRTRRDRVHPKHGEAAVLLGRRKVDGFGGSGGRGEGSDPKNKGKRSSSLPSSGSNSSIHLQSRPVVEKRTKESNEEGMGQAPGNEGRRDGQSKKKTVKRDDSSSKGGGGGGKRPFAFASDLKGGSNRKGGQSPYVIYRKRRRSLEFDYHLTKRSSSFLEEVQSSSKTRRSQQRFRLPEDVEDEEVDLGVGPRLDRKGRLVYGSRSATNARFKDEMMGGGRGGEKADERSRGIDQSSQEGAQGETRETSRVGKALRGKIRIKPLGVWRQHGSDDLSTDPTESERVDPIQPCSANASTEASPSLVEMSRKKKGKEFEKGRSRSKMIRWSPTRIRLLISFKRCFKIWLSKTSTFFYISKVGNGRLTISKAVVTSVNKIYDRKGDKEEEMEMSKGREEGPLDVDRGQEIPEAKPESTSVSHPPPLQGGLDGNQLQGEEEPSQTHSVDVDRSSRIGGDESLKEEKEEDEQQDISRAIEREAGKERDSLDLTEPKMPNSRGSSLRAYLRHRYPVHRLHQAHRMKLKDEINSPREIGSMARFGREKKETERRRKDLGFVQEGEREQDSAREKGPNGTDQGSRSRWWNWGPWMKKDSYDCWSGRIKLMLTFPLRRLLGLSFIYQPTRHLGPSY